MTNKLWRLMLLLSLLCTTVPAHADLPFGLSDHTVRGTVGTIGAGWITLIKADHSMMQVFFPAGYHAPPDIQAGKNVRLTYKINDFNQCILVKVKEAGGSAPSGISTPSGVVNSVPHI